MATTSRDSGLLADGARHASPTAPGEIWLEGDVLACACPECHALMSIRLWLMVADCTRCGTSVELSEQQEQEALRLLRRRRVQPLPKAPLAPPLAPPPPPPPPEPVLKPAPKPEPPSAAPPLAKPPREKRLPMATLVKLRRRLDPRELPAWLISTLIHIALLLLLAMLVDTVRNRPQPIVLSAVIGPNHEVGEPGLEGIEDDIQIAEPGSPPVVENPAALAPVPLSDHTVDAAFPLPELPASPTGAGLPLLPSAIDSSGIPAGIAHMFAGRDPRLRTTLVRREGGTTYTEAAVDRGLRWLSKHQSSNGSWMLEAFHKVKGCDGKCSGPGSMSDMAGTGLALLPFLGAGETHLSGRYREIVERGLAFLLENQEKDGDLRGVGAASMYAHGQCAIVLCEALALTGDKKLREPAQKAIDFIVAAQHGAGGWRYSPGMPGDTSVLGWQLMALHSARMARLKIPKSVFARAALYLDSAEADPYGSTYAYQPGMYPRSSMTAEALLCRQYLGWPKNHPGLNRGIRLLLEEDLPGKQPCNIYYWYYATQVMHHMGGEVWQTWNLAIRDRLVAMQETKGHAAGSWDADLDQSGYKAAGGRIYMTSLAICILEVYYRHLPIYRSLKQAPPVSD